MASSPPFLFAIFFIILAISVLQMNALECYECESSNNKGCGDQFNDKTVRKVTCTQDCLKAVFKDGPFKGTHRVCPIVRAQRDKWCREQKAEFCEYCATDLCNGSGQYGSITVLVAIPAIIAKYFIF